MPKFIKLTCWLVAVFFGFSVAANAQQAAKPKIPAPMLDAIKKAVSTNPEVQAKWNGFLAADSQRDIAKAGFLPQVDLSASIGRETRVTPTQESANYNTRTAQLTLNQILFDGFFTINEVRRLGAAKLTRYYELVEASENAALEAVKAYADVVRYRETVDLTTQNYIEHKQATMMVEERANAGVGRRVDVEQANGRLALAESNLLTELTNLHDVSARYLRVVGEVPPTNLPPLAEPFNLGPMPTGVDKLMREGLLNSPTLLAAVQNARSYGIAVSSAKSTFMPRLDFQVFGNQSTNTNAVAGDTNARGAAVTLTFNLFKGGADKAKEKQAVYLAEQARDLQEKACRDVRQLLALAYSDVRSLNEQLEYIDRHRLATEKTREAYRQQFDIGQRTLLDLLDTQNEFFEASRSYINTRHNQAAAQARTLAAMGRLMPVLGVTREGLPSAQEAGQDDVALKADEVCPMDAIVVDTLEKIKSEIVLPERAKAVAAAPVAGKKDCGRIILLPDEDGGVGMIEAKSNSGSEVKLDKPYATASDGCDKVVVVQTSPEEVAKIFPVVATLPPKARYYRLNFELGKTVMLPESEGVIGKVIEDYQSSASPEITIIGHADKLGTPERNLALSQRRAKVILEMLTKGGVPNSAKIQQAWRGDLEPLPGTEELKEAPINRRVEVKIQ